MLFAPVRSMIASSDCSARRHAGGGGHGGSDGSGPFVAASAPAGAPLAALAGGALARRFYRWSGRSGARYVVTVHALESEDWREIAGAVVLVAEVDLDGGRRIVAVESDPSIARRRQLACSAARGARAGLRFEAHLHLLAESAAARGRVAGDLAATMSG